MLLFKPQIYLVFYRYSYEKFGLHFPMKSILTELYTKYKVTSNFIFTIYLSIYLLYSITNLIKGKLSDWGQKWWIHSFNILFCLSFTTNSTRLSDREIWFKSMFSCQLFWKSQGYYFAYRIQLTEVNSFVRSDRSCPCGTPFVNPSQAA